jgi:hypothetical protein
MLQDILGDMESKLFARHWRDYQAEKPIFVTSLPRAGTTIVLEVLHRLPGLAVHTYRDMPFLLTPVLWNRVSQGFHHRSAQRERAHGDGLKVNEDSPEAFEEVLWKKFFSHKYTGNNIALWASSDLNAEFTAYLRDHMKKIVSLRQPGHMVDGRYVSKNNANIARIAVLKHMCPDAHILVPFRDPVEHAVSMWRQHRNFISQHAEEPFVRDYMADIGHFEFGALHKPIAMDGRAALCGDFDPESTDYWLAYWICCFKHLAQQQGIRLVCYESLCSSALESVTRLAEVLEIKAGADEIASAASVLSPAPPGRGDAHNFSPQLLARASDVHDGLMSRCILAE